AEPLSKLGIKQKVLEMVGQSPSNEWITKFLKEFPDICGYKARGLDPKHAAAFNKPVVHDYFNKLEEIIEHYQIPRRNIYNMDEKGIQLGGGRKNSNTLYFFDKGDKSRYILKSDSLVLVTVIETACADGTMLPPGFILPSGTPVAWWEWNGVGIVTETDNGWTCDAIGSQWFHKVFIPSAKAHSDPTKAIVLVLDGHGSHNTTEMVSYAFQYNIILITLPPHTTHRLQPLDVGIFGPLQRSWVKHCENMGIRRQEITRETVIPEYMKVRAKSITEASVHNAFKKSGLWPVDRNVFTDGDFAPSLQFLDSGSQPVAPSSYPAYVPSSPNSAQSTERGTNSDSDMHSSEYVNEDGSHSDNTVIHIMEDDDFDDIQDYEPSSPLGSPLPTKRTRWTRSFDQKSVAPATNGSMGVSPSKLTKIEYLEVQLQRTTALYMQEKLRRQAVEAQLKATEAHCSIQSSRIQDLQQRVNQATKPRRRRGALTTKNAEVLSRPEAKETFEQQCAQKEAEEQEAKAKQKQKQAEARACEIERARKATTEVYKAPLHCYKRKEELKDIAYVFGLEITGKNDELKKRIQEHMASHPDLKKNRRFEGLFAKQ
ncbi:hypothetical protein M422DRAFT_139398, partial [Sphaerobolus stellatus SS14]